MKETEMKIKLIASAKVMASMVEWAEDTSVAIYGCGQILLEASLGYARVLLEAICHVASVAFDNGRMILEISVTQGSELLAIITEWIKDGLSSDTVDNTIHMVRDALEVLLMQVCAMLKASYGNGEEYRILSSTLNNIFGVNYNPRLFSDMFKNL